MMKDKKKLKPYSTKLVFDRGFILPGRRAVTRVVNLKQAMSVSKRDKPITLPMPPWLER